MNVDNTTTTEFVEWFEANVSAVMGSDSIQWRYARMGWNAALARSKTVVSDDIDFLLISDWLETYAESLFDDLEDQRDHVCEQAKLLRAMA